MVTFQEFTSLLYPGRPKLDDLKPVWTLCATWYLCEMFEITHLLPCRLTLVAKDLSVESKGVPMIYVVSVTLSFSCLEGIVDDRRLQSSCLDTEANEKWNTNTLIAHA